MDAILQVFIATGVSTVTAAAVAGIIASVGKLGKMEKMVKSLAASTEAVYRVQPKLIAALRHHSSALKEIGANGSTGLANKCLDEADEALDRRLAERVGGAA